MKKYKIILTVALCAVLLVATVAVLTACENKYISLDITTQDGYSVVFEDGRYIIKNAASDTIGRVELSSIVISTDSTGVSKPVGLEKGRTLDVSIYLLDIYDPLSLSVSANSTALARKSISSYNDVSGDAELHYTKINFSYEPQSSEKEIDISIDNIKNTAIAGNKWKLFGLKDGENVYGPGNIYESMVIGTEIDYRFDFKLDGTVSATFKDEGKVELSGTWTEQNGILTAVLSDGTKTKDFTFTVMTPEERKALITDKEKLNGISEDKKAVGIGIMSNSGSLQILMVLDI